MRIFVFCLMFFFALSVLQVQAQVYNRAELWNAEVNALTDIDSKQTAPKNAVLFVGSSSIRMWKNLRADFPNRAFINRGFGGARLEDVNFYFDRLVAPYKPKIIVLYAGENDVNDGIAPEKIAADFRAFAALVDKHLPKAKIVYISLKPSPARLNLRGKFEQTNRLIKAEIEKDKQIEYADVWSAMLSENGEPRAEIYLEDNLHLNEKGYAIWREVLKSYLK